MKRTLWIILGLFFLSSTFSYSQFGKNKVQYKEFDWKYIQSDHFDVYYNDGSKYLAEFTALTAEKSLKSIERLLSYDMTKRTTFVVYDSHNEFQQTNVISVYMPEGVGGVTELYKNRVVVPFQGDYSLFDHVIHHELVHAVLNDMFYGGTFQSAVASGSNFSIPLWMNEGICEYESRDGYDTETDMFMRDLTISEKLPPLERLRGYLSYRGGQAFYWYVAREYGKQRVGDLINRLLVERNVNNAFKSAFNMSLEDFSEKWEKDMKKLYWPDLETFEGLEDFASQITDREEEGNYYNSSPAISPNGEKMAYISAPDGIFGIFIRDLDDPESARKLVSSSRSQDFEDLNMLTPGISWNPEGTQLAVSAKSGGEDAIYIVEAEDGDFDKYKWGFNKIASVSWSPDGKKLAFVGSVRERSDLYVYNIETEELTNITDDIFSDMSPEWSPDSKKIYFISDRADYGISEFNRNNFGIWNEDVYKSDLYSIKIDGSNLKRLTFDPKNKKTSVVITPDNKYALFVSDKNGISNIYKLDLKTLKTEPITNSISAITQLSIAKDASKLLFTSQVDAGYDIYMIRYPMERDLKIDELPLTTYKKQLQEKRSIVEDITEFKDREEPSKLTGYGNFEVDFEEQKLVKPNEQAQQNDIETDMTSANTSDTTKKVNFEEKDYKVSFSPDIIMGNPGFSTFYGVQGVTQMLFSDELGDHQIYAQANLQTDLTNSQFYVAYNNLPNIIDYSFSLYHRTAYVRQQYAEPNNQNNLDFYRFRDLGGGIKAAYPLSLFKRFEGNLHWMWLSENNIEKPTAPSNSLFMAVPEIKYVYDNTMFGYYGPSRGTRYFVSGKYSPKIGNEGVSFSMFMGDFRHYIPIVGNYVSIAMRGAGGVSLGPDPKDFYLGGMSNWINAQYHRSDYLPFDDPEDFAFLYESFQMPLRGWSVSHARGDKFAMANFEVRFPLLTALIGPFLVQGVMGNVFFDVGAAWYDDEIVAAKVNETGNKIPQDVLMSTGFGIRSYFLGLPWKVDIAWRNEYSGWSKPKYLISLGYDF